MKIKYEENAHLNHHEMCVTFHPRNREAVASIVSLMKKTLGDIKVFDDHYNYYHISIISIYYIEVVEHKIFLYTKDNVYRKNDTLKALKKRLQKFHFFQINAKTLVNKNHVVSYQVKKDCRRLLDLDNGECLIVNRYYKDELTKNMIVKNK